MEAKPKYFIYYNNGDFETSGSINMTLLHMIEVGVIKIIFDCNGGTAWVRAADGPSKEVKVHHVDGL